MVANVAVWVEDHDGTIVRGLAETVTAGGARIRLSSMPGFGQGVNRIYEVGTEFEGSLFDKQRRQGVAGV